MDKILIKDLLVRCVIGVSDEERREKQDVTINIVLSTDTQEAGRRDDIAAAVNYRDIKKRVMAMAEKSSYHLVETLAERVAEICLADARVHAAQVTVEKPSALRFARSVGVEISRARS
jgi:dihydroneopterin aldolase/D-erythro-7,8-dihydroneopterin triphosphate epimerase